MAEIRKLGRPTAHRMAMLKNQVTSLLTNGQIQTTEARAKEVKSIVDSMISEAVKVKDAYEMVEVKVSKAKVDDKGRKITEKAMSKNGKTFYKVVREEVTQNVQKDSPERLAVRRRIIRNVNKIKDAKGNNIDLPSKLFNEIAPKYEKNVGGYTRIIKIGKRRGDAAETVILQLV